MNKRYAIVRVNNCPSIFEKGFNDYFVCDGRDKDMRLGKDKIICSNCRYGDTKEQLIAKVRQVLEREIQQKHIEVEFDNGFILSLTTKGLAKEIVEFLGVEEC